MSSDEVTPPNDQKADRTLEEVREILAGAEQRRQDWRIEALEAKLAVTTARLDQLNQQVELLKVQLAGKSGGDDGGSTAATE